MLPIFSIPSGVKSFDLSEKAGTNEHVANLERLFCEYVHTAIVFAQRFFSKKILPILIPDANLALQEFIGRV